MSRALARNDRFDLSYDDDRAMGMGGNDTLHGNDGDDTLTGGSGADRHILTGGRSADVFIFRNPGHAGDTYHLRTGSTCASLMQIALMVETTLLSFPKGAVSSRTNPDS